MWDEKRTLHFIELYKKKRLLWDHKHPHHYNKHLKEQAWEDLSAAIDVPAEDCRKKMFSLQSSLRREKCKIRKSHESGKEADEMYISNWFAFKSLSFILDLDKSFKSTMEAQQRLEESRVDDIDSDHESRSRQFEKPDKKRKATDTYDRPPLSKNPVPPVASTSRTEEEDICQLFANLVAKRMRMYSPLVQSAVQQAVMTVLFNADSGYYDQKPSSPVFDPALSQHSQCHQHTGSSQTHYSLNSPANSSDQLPALSPIPDSKENLEFM